MRSLSGLIAEPGVAIRARVFGGRCSPGSWFWRRGGFAGGARRAGEAAAGTGGWAGLGVLA